MTNELPLKDSSSTSFAPRSILRHSKSGLSSRRKEVIKKDRKDKQNKKTSEGWWRKFSSGWSVILVRLRTLSNHIFSSDEYVEDLFVEESSLSMIERIDRSSRGVTKTEEEFLSEFSKVKSLDRMYQTQKDKSKAGSKANTFSLEDFIRSSNNNGGSNDAVADDLDGAPKKDGNVVPLSQVFASQESVDSMGGPPSQQFSNLNSDNVGELLWEYRRKKWLEPTKSPEMIEDHIARQSLDHIPIESYEKIYRSLIDRGKSLKNEKAINLKDLIKIINHGWVLNEKWERAAKGFA